MNSGIFIVLLMAISLMVLPIYLTFCELAENKIEVYFLETRQVLIMISIFYIVIIIEEQENVGIFYCSNYNTLNI